MAIVAVEITAQPTASEITRATRVRPCSASASAVPWHSSVAAKRTPSTIHQLALNVVAASGGVAASTTRDTAVTVRTASRAGRASRGGGIVASCGAAVTGIRPRRGQRAGGE